MSFSQSNMRLLSKLGIWCSVDLNQACRPGGKRLTGCLVLRELGKLTRFSRESLSRCIVTYQYCKGGTELKSFVVEYVRERGNGDATEVLDDYMEYLQLHGYVVRRKNRNMARTDHVTRIQKALTIHLVDPPVSNQP